LDKSLSYNSDLYNTAEDPFLHFIDSPNSSQNSLTTSHLYTPRGSEEPILPQTLSQNALIDLPDLTPSSSVQNSPTFPYPPTPSIASSSVSRKRKSTHDLTLDSPRPKDLPPIVIDENDDDRDVKRKRNTAAARRYRQKKQDRVKDLEDELEEMKKERDMYKEMAARNQMEAEKWKSIVDLMQAKR